MNDEQLRSLQAPLKEQYRADPGAAVITLEAEGQLGDENITCKVSTGKAMVEAGLHPAIITQRKTQPVTAIYKLECSLQQVIAIGATAHHMQKKVQFCRGRPDAHAAILATAAAPFA